VQTITTAQIRDAFRDAILGIAPTFEPLRSVRWSFTPSGRTRGRADLLGKATRSFDLIFGAGTPTFLWTGGTGTAYACRVAVATSYAGVEPETLEHVLTADAVDLRRVLDALRDPALPGLCDITVRGLENIDADDEANAYVEHVFTVHYHQATE
jgi:hypothetical protein